SLDGAVGGLDPHRVFLLVDIGYPGVVEYQATGPGQGLDQPGQGPSRVEMELVVELDRCLDVEGQVGQVGERRRKPETLGGVDLILDAAALVRVQGIGKGRGAGQVTADAELLDQLGDPLDPGLV